MQNNNNNKYSQGKIYFLMNDSTNEVFYVGSTTLNLNRRLGDHISKSFNSNAHEYNTKRCQYIRSIGSNNLSIHLLENFPCNSRNELLFRERYWIEQFIPICNMKNSILSIEERINDDRKKSKLYWEKNKENIKCVCGYTYTKHHKQRHFETKKHFIRIMEIYQLD